MPATDKNTRLQGGTGKREKKIVLFTVDTLEKLEKEDLEVHLREVVGEGLTELPG